MCTDMSPLEKAIQFHGHICPELLMGVRAAETALDLLGAEPNHDEDLGAIVENHDCGVDAIQAILGCTFGKGNLYYRDHGKMVYTIFSLKSQRAVRIAQKFEVLQNPVIERYQQLRCKDDPTEAEEIQREDALAQVFEWIMSQPLELIFHWQETKMPDLAKARVQPNVQCQKCGEGVVKARAVLTEQGLLCPECYAGQRSDH